MFVGFVDFKTVFDSVDREVLIEKLKKRGINGRFLNMIKEIYKNTENEIITEEGISEKFKTKRGVRQGCPLSPTLFNIYIEDLEDQWAKNKTGGTVIGKTKIYCLKFADDVAIIADTKEGLQEMLNGLEKFSDRNGMEVNTQKTKIMVFQK